MSEPIDPHEFSARLHRILAGRLRVEAAKHDLLATMATTAKAMKTFAEAFNAGIAQDVANHPDLAELNVQLDGFYGAGPVRPDEEG